MADNRVLNFSEFGKKYSQESEQDIAASYSEFSKASDNFQEGFDDDTYEDGQSGPKRPINTTGMETPAQPGEDGAPSFTSEPVAGMEAPTSGTETPNTPKASAAPTNDHITIDDVEDEDLSGDSNEYEEVGDDEDYGSGNPEEEDEDDTEEEEEDEDDTEEEEEEDDKEETNESFRIGRNNIVLESFDDFEMGNRNTPYSSQPTIKSLPRKGYDEVLNTIELDMDDEGESDNECFVTCKSCGAKKMIDSQSYPMGSDNVFNPDSWWQGAEMGMQCGCRKK